MDPEPDPPAPKRTRGPIRVSFSTPVERITTISEYQPPNLVGADEAPVLVPPPPLPQPSSADLLSETNAFSKQGKVKSTKTKAPPSSTPAASTSFEYKPGMPFINIPKVQAHANKNGIQRSTGVEGQTLNANDYYSIPWLKNEVSALMNVWMDPYFKTLRQIEGFSGVAPVNQAQGFAHANTNLSERSVLQALSFIDSDKAAQMAAQEAVVNTSTRDRTIAQTDPGAIVPDGDEDADPERPLNTKPKTTEEPFKAKKWTSRWDALHDVLRDPKIRLTDTTLKALGYLFPSNVPNTFEWSAMVQHIGTAVINPTVVAHIESSYRELLRINNGTEISLPIAAFFTSDAVRSDFARLVSFDILRSQVVRGQRVLSELPIKEGKRLYNLQLLKMSNLTFDGENLHMEKRAERIHRPPKYSEALEIARSYTTG